MNNLRTLETLNGTARQLGISPMSLLRWLARYHIPHFRVGSVIALDVAEVQAILIANGKLAAHEDRR